MIEKNSLFHQKISKSKLKNLRSCGNFLIQEIFSSKISKIILEGGVVAENFVRNNLELPHSCVRSPANCDGRDHEVDGIEICSECNFNNTHYGFRGAGVENRRNKRPRFASKFQKIPHGSPPPPKKYHINP